MSDSVILPRGFTMPAPHWEGHKEQSQRAFLKGFIKITDKAIRRGTPCSSCCSLEAVKLITALAAALMQVI